jgi:hypothetical protein
MADLGFLDDKLLNNQNQQGANPDGSPQVGVGSSGVVTGGSNQGLAQQSGVGAGGQGSWTNIQAYLNANQKDTGSAQALEKKVGSTLQNEQSKLNSEVDKTVSDANRVAGTYDDAKANTKTWINQAANAYDWDGQHGQEYGNTVNKVKGLMTQQYQGPQDFNYATSQDYNRGQEALKNDQAFKSYLGDMYREKAGGQMSSGQLALQNQFDVNNENLAKTRTRMLDQMAGFDTDKQDAIKRADTGIQEAQNKFRNDQSAFNDSLFNMQNELDSNINQQEIDARNAYQKDYSTGLSGRANAVKSNYNDFTGLSGGGFTDYIAALGEVQGLQDRGLFGDNLTYQQLQQQRDYDSNLGNFKNVASVKGDGIVLQNYLRDLAGGNSALDNFYSTQDQKYGMTADSEERAYNTLSEILGSLNKKEKGFKVRG